MSQHDLDIANADGATVRADVNAAFDAIATRHSGATAPTTTFANMPWYDTATSLMKRRNAANTAWVTVFDDLDSEVLIGAVGVFIGDTANSKMTVGLTINQGSADNDILTFKSSDVAHGLTSLTETDTYAYFKKPSGTLGGMAITAIAEATAEPVFSFEVYGGDWGTAKSSSALGAFVYYATEHDGANGTRTPTSDANVFVVRANTTAGVRSLFIVAEDGDIHVDGSATVGTFDAWDDAVALRSFERWRHGEADGKMDHMVLASRFDDNMYSKEELEQTKIIQVVDDDEWLDGNRSLVNAGALGRLTTGAIWQNHEMIDAILEAQEAAFASLGLDNFQTDFVRPCFVKRGIPTQILDWTGPIPANLQIPDLAPKAFNA